MEIKGLSIVVTYYKGEKFIFKCLDSIFGSFNLSLKKIQFEVLIVIDSMDDASYIEHILKERYQSQPLVILKNSKNIGVSASRNAALGRIKYQYYTVIDQDDFVKEAYFSVLESNLDDNVAVHILNGTVFYLEKNIQVPIYFLKPVFQFKSLLLKDTYIYTPGLLVFNSKFVPSANFFVDTSEKYKGCDDWAAYLNILLNTETKLPQKYLRQVLFVYCLHSTNYSNNVAEMSGASLAVLDFLSKHAGLSKTNEKLLQRAYKMHNFYYAKDVENESKLKSFLKYPSSFLSHYFYSFFKQQRLNRLIFRGRHLLKRYQISLR